MSDTERETRWYSKSQQWKVIPVCFLLIGIERTFTGINLFIVKASWFGTTVLIVGIFFTVCGAILLRESAQPPQD